MEHFYQQYLKRRFGINSCASPSNGDLLYNKLLIDEYADFTAHDPVDRYTPMIPETPVPFGAYTGITGIPQIITSLPPDPISPIGAVLTETSNNFVGTAGENLGGGRLVYLHQDKFYTYDGTSEALADALFGITRGAAWIGNNVVVQYGGIFLEPGMELISGETYFAGPAGQLVLTPSSVSTIVGIAITAQSIKIEIQQSIILLS